MKSRQISVTTEKIIVKPGYEEWRLIIGYWEFQFYGYDNFWNWVFSFCIKNVMFLDFVSSTICNFLLFSLWLLVSTTIMAGFWIWSCAFLQFWAIFLGSDISKTPYKKPKSKIHFPRRGDKYPLRGISLKGVCRETKTAHFHQIFQLSTPGRAVGIAYVSLKMGPTFQCIKIFL